MDTIVCCPDSILGLKFSLLQLLGVLATDRFQLCPFPKRSLDEERHPAQGHMPCSSSLHLMTSPMLEYKVLLPCAKLGPIWKATLVLTLPENCLRLFQLHLNSFIHLYNSASLSQEDSLEEGMPTHSSILAWRIPWREEPGGLQSMGSQRVGHD